MKTKNMIPVFAIGMFIVGGKNVLATPEVYSAVNVISMENEQVQLPNEIVSLDNKTTIVKETIQWDNAEDYIFSQPGSYEVYGKTENNNKVKGIINVFPKNQKIKVAAVGDSITYGMNVERRTVNSYPNQLNYRLGTDYQVENFGHSAKTLLSNGDNPYLKSPQYKKSLAFNPNVVVIQLGTNDTKKQNMKKIEPFVDDYVSLIESYKDLSTKPVVYISLPPHVFKPAYGITQEKLDDILPQIFDAAKKADIDVSIIDNFTETDYAAELVPDGVHPNARGAAILANNVYYNLKGEAPVISEGMALNDYYKTYGGLNVDQSGSLEIQNLATNSWVSFKNVDLKGKDLQLFASVPYDNTKVIVRSGDENGTIIGEKILTKTSGAKDYSYQTVPLNGVAGLTDITITFERAKSNKSSEIVKLAKADFFYDSEKPLDVSNFQELETAVKNNISKIKLGSDIKLAKKIELKEDTAIDLNGYTLDTANYYIGKDEKSGKRIELSLSNGNLLGKYSNGSIYSSKSTKENYGLNVSFENVLFAGKVTQTNFSPNTMIIEKGQNQLVHALSSSNTLVYTDADTSNRSLDLYGAVPYTNTYITIRKGTENGEVVGEKLLDRTGSINKDATHSIPLTNVSEQEDLFIKVERKGTNGYTELMRVK